MIFIAKCFLLIAAIAPYPTLTDDVKSKLAFVSLSHYQAAEARLIRESNVIQVPGYSAQLSIVYTGRDKRLSPISMHCWKDEPSGLFWAGQQMDYYIQTKSRLIGISRQLRFGNIFIYKKENNLKTSDDITKISQNLTQLIYEDPNSLLENYQHVGLREFTRFEFLFPGRRSNFTLVEITDVTLKGNLLTLSLLNIDKVQVEIVLNCETLLIESPKVTPFPNNVVPGP